MSGSRADAWIVTAYKNGIWYWNGWTGQWQRELIVFLNNAECKKTIDAAGFDGYTVTRFIYDIDVDYKSDEQPVEADFTWTPRSRCPWEHPQD